MGLPINSEDVQVSPQMLRREMELKVQMEMTVLIVSLSTVIKTNSG